LVAGLILLLDRQPWVAVFWAFAGLLLGLFGLIALRPFADPLFEWYRSLNQDAEFLQLRIHSLIRKGKANSEEFKCCIKEDSFWMALAISPLCGLFHGGFIGPIIGALCGFDDAGISASGGALLGMLIGPVLVACWMSLIMACTVDLDRRLPFRGRLVRRGLLVVSPLLIVPATWHCLRRIFRTN
jgi:hypothetical protein